MNLPEHEDLVLTPKRWLIREMHWLLFAEIVTSSLLILGVWHNFYLYLKAWPFLVLWICVIAYTYRRLQYLSTIRFVIEDTALVQLKGASVKRMMRDNIRSVTASFMVLPTIPKHVRYSKSRLRFNYILARGLGMTSREARDYISKLTGKDNRNIRFTLMDRDGEYIRISPGDFDNEYRDELFEYLCQLWREKHP